MDKKETSQYGWICFEPCQEYRGDFARTYFYMVKNLEFMDEDELIKDLQRASAENKKKREEVKQILK